jgi:hypothetical protein
MTYTCYQETANASSSADTCFGLNYTGNYSYNGTWTNINNAWDGNWGTAASNTATDDIYINYTKPQNANDAMLTYLYNVFSNYTLSTLGCFTPNPIRIRFHKYNTLFMGFYCWDGATWQNPEAGFTNDFYEEAIIWNISGNATTTQLKTPNTQLLEDTTVRIETPDTNEGSATYLDANASWNSYFKFNLVGILNPLRKALLCLQIVDYGDVAFNSYIWSVSNQTWTEENITWSNAPTASSLLNTTSVLTDSVWYCHDVTSWVSSEISSGHTNVSFKWNASGSTGFLRSQSKESLSTSIRPYLNITSLSIDTTAPQYSNIATDGVNRTNTSVQFNTTWTETTGGWIFESNISGAFTNSTLNTTFIDMKSIYYMIINLTRGQTFSWRFYANDTTGNINNTMPYQVFTVLNTEPRAVSTFQTTTSYYTNANISINWSDAYDNDSDTIYYQFYINTSGSYQIVYNGTDSNYTTNISLDGTYKYKVGTWDSYAYGDNSSEQTIILDLSPPFFSNNVTNASAVAPKNDHVIQVNVTLSDTTNISFVRIAHNATGTFVNGSAVRINRTSLQIIENITISGLYRGNQFAWQVWANDTWGRSNANLFTVIVQNSNPTLKTDLTFTNFSAGHGFNVSVTFSDADLGTDFINPTIENSTGTCYYISNSTSGDDFTIKYNCTGTALTSTNIRINATDLGAITINSTVLSNTFPNQEPTLTNVELNHTAGVIDTEDLVCNLTGANDSDNDLVRYYYEWYVDGAAIGLNETLLRSGNLTNGEQWYCEGWVSDYYENSSKYTSTVVLIGSSFIAPTIDNWNVTTANVNSSVATPTNNNSYINFSVMFTDGNTDKWTMFICSTPTWADCLNNVSGSIYCISGINSSGKILSCLYNVSGNGLSSTTYNYYSFVLDNTTLVSGAKQNQFNINHPPSIPIIHDPLNNTFITVNYVLINYTVTDSDTDIINVTMYNSTNMVAWALLNINVSFYNWTNLSDATYYLKAYSIDHHNYSLNINSSITMFTVDTINPSVSLISPPSNTYQNTSMVLVQYRPYDTNLKNCTIWNDFSGSWQIYDYNFTATSGVQATFNATLPDAQYTWNVQCNDTPGHTAFNTSNYTFTIDTTMPNVDIVLPADNSYNSSYVIKYIGSDANLMNCTLFGNFSGVWQANETNSSMTSDSAGYFNVSYMADGNYIYNIQCNDTAQNAAFNTSNYTFTLDTVYPVINALSASNTAPYTTYSVTFTAIVTDKNIGLTSCKFTFMKSDYNGGNGVGIPYNVTTTTIAGTSISIPYSMAALGTGTLEWQKAYCVDYAGLNTSNLTVGINITITTAPVTPGGSSGGTTLLAMEPVDIQAQINASLTSLSVCGNGVCQDGEWAGNCPQDCGVNQLLCFITDTTCPSWVFSAVIYLIVGTVLFVLVQNQLGGFKMFKRKKR